MKLNKVEEHNGCQNIVFHMSTQTVEGYVRVTVRADRTPEDVMAELNFIQHLDEEDVPVAVAYRSKDGDMMSWVECVGKKFPYVIFKVAKGEQLCQRGYQYIKGIPLRTHHYNCGRILAQVHNASETYVPVKGKERHHVMNHVNKLIHEYLPQEKSVIRNRFTCLIEQLEKVERDAKSYGLIHGDFGDGNYNIDYENGDITLYDFDDVGYGWYMYEVACAWAAARGWVRWEKNMERRKVLMDEIFTAIVEGYRSVRELEDTYLEQLPLYLKLHQMECYLDNLRYVAVTEGTRDHQDDKNYINYLTKCIEKDIPYLGLYDEESLF